MKKEWIKIIRQSTWSARIGFCMVLIILIAAIFAPLIAPYSEEEIVGSVWEPVGSEYLLGTDQIGRDMLSRLVYGARNTISLAIAVTALAFFIGLATGFLAAVYGGWVDQLLSRIVDILMSIPTLIFALLILSVLGTSIPALVGVIALLDSTRVFRIARALGMDVEVMEYVEAAWLRGEGIWWIMRYELLPNTMSPLLAEFGLRFIFVFLFISALSFLGLGLQPPTADWGAMVRENSGALSFGIVAPLLPAAAIAFLSIGVNLVVDWFLQRSSHLRQLS